MLHGCWFIAGLRLPELPMTVGSRGQQKEPHRRRGSEALEIRGIGLEPTCHAAKQSQRAQQAQIQHPIHYGGVT